MAIYGRKATIDADSGIIGSGQLRSNVYLPAVENGWIYRWGIHAGDSGSGAPHPIIRGQIHTAGPTPAALVAYTNEVEVTTFMGGGSMASEVTAPTVSIVPVVAGQVYAIGAASRNASLLHGMIVAGSLPASYNRTMYQRAVGSTGPFDPHGWTNTITAGWMTTWFEYQPNRAPNTPTGLSPSGEIDGQPAAFTGGFSDPDQLVDGRPTQEGMSNYRIQLRRDLDGVLLWDELYVASAGEKVANMFSHAYEGSQPLDPGENYSWRAQTVDFFGTPSPWTGWTSFFITSAGSVVRNGDGGVALRQTTQQPGPFLVTYAHVDGLSATEHQIQILQGGTVVRDETITAAWAPGNHSVTPTWGAGFAALPWGTQYTWRVRARDSAGDLSSWSPQTAFNTNYKPNTPTNLTPTSGEVSSGYPELSFTLTDQDNTPTTGLVSKLRIVDEASSFIERVATYSDGRWRYQTTGTDLPATGSYDWYARGEDGTLIGDWSPEATFYYAEQPIISNPVQDEAVTSTTIPVTYAVTGQVERRALVYLMGGETPVFTTDWEATSSLTMNVDGSEYLLNGLPYDIVIEVELPNGVVTRSDRVTVELLLESGHSVDLVEESSGPVTLPGDMEPTAVTLIRGTTTGITSGNFRSWRVREGPPDWANRWAALLADLPTDPGDALRAQVQLVAELEVVAESLTYEDTAFTHFEPRLGVSRSYVLTAVIQASELNRVESLPQGVITATCETTAVVVHDTLFPTERRVFLEFLDSSAGEDVSDKELYFPWSDGPGIVLETGRAYERVVEMYHLIPHTGEPAQEAADRLRALARYREDDSPIIVCHRDDVGNRRWVRIMSLSWERQYNQSLDVSVEYVETRRES